MVPAQGYFGEVDFSFRGKAGQAVSVIGNFNQWDPFADDLDEVSPGEYRLKLTLPPGTVLYRFVIGTKTFLDPENAHTGQDDQGGSFSFFENKVIAPATIREGTMTAAVAHP